MNEGEKEIERLRTLVQSQLMNSIGGAVKSANENFRLLASTLIGIAAFLFTISSPFIINLFKEGLIENSVVKVLLTISWSFLFTSIILGIVQLFIDNAYYDKEIIRLGKRITLFSKYGMSPEEFAKCCDQSEQIRQESDYKSPEIFVLLQSIFLTIGFLFVLITALVIMF